MLTDNCLQARKNNQVNHSFVGGIKNEDVISLCQSQKHSNRNISTKKGTRDINADIQAVLSALKFIITLKYIPNMSDIFPNRKC